MTKEQVKEWITDYLNKNPQLATQYKEQKLSHLNAEMKYDEALFKREGDEYIKEHSEHFKDVNNTACEDLLIDSFIEVYVHILESTEHYIDKIKNYTDEDLYIDSVFRGTDCEYICWREGVRRYQAFYTPKENKIYKKGLLRRDELVKKGEELQQKHLKEQKELLKQLEDIDTKGPAVIQRLIDAEVMHEKSYRRCLAHISVVDAFDKMGAYPTSKQAEQIDEIIEMHDPSVVESAMQSLLKSPTKNIVALAQNIKEAPAQDRKTLKILKALDISQIALGALFSALGIANMSLGSSQWHIWFDITMSALNFGPGISGIIHHTRKIKNLDQKEPLLSACIQDLLNEVELQEAFNKGLEG